MLRKFRFSDGSELKWESDEETDRILDEWNEKYNETGTSHLIAKSIASLYKFQMENR